MRAKQDSRLFFALWPDEALREQLQRVSDTIAVERPARHVPRGNLHLTLHFIGNVFFEEVNCLREQARLVSTTSFDFDIDCQGHFKKSRVAWLGCHQIPASLNELHDQLGQRLQRCGYQPEARQYNPHVTVARKIGPIAECENFAPIAWKVEHFSLVEVCPVKNGVQYCVIETYPLI